MTECTSQLDEHIPKSPPAPNMVWIPGGTFLMGSNQHYPEEAPAHPVTIDGFWMDQYTVTNEQFERFVAATGYVTVAERPLDPQQYPGVDPILLVPGSLVFQQPSHPVDLSNVGNWWAYIPGANWRHPAAHQFRYVERSARNSGSAKLGNGPVERASDCRFEVGLCVLVLFARCIIVNIERRLPCVWRFSLQERESSDPTSG